MKKDKNSRDSATIIPFPGLKERYFEKGVASLESHHFQEAVDMLRYAHQMDPDDPQISAAFLAALYENGDYDESKRIAEELLKVGLGNFYDILDIYLMILIQLNDYKQVITTLEPLFEENEVPPDKAEHYVTLLQLSKRAAGNQIMADSSKEDHAPLIHNGQSLQEQLASLNRLKDKNIHPYLPSLIERLADEKVHPFIKTVILILLKENEIDQMVLVKKFDRQKTCNPKKIPSIEEFPIFYSVKSQIESQLRDHNPVLLEQIHDMIKRHSFYLYPFELNPAKPAVWAAAYRAMGHEMYGENWRKNKLAEYYGVEEKELETAFAFIVKLEEISSTIV
ncbi:hypothetical protein MUB24_02910 [Lederbergia sp. NSJ-179]|uniref:tetratricopeptide repeat protein n=1 Tax=Lederbergia sp. NSJ-179 TaxID=2931402 RepID=UPI001FCFA5A1|nr:tetratricopeptide repeat protein [Lederbergia sp. NSJ-179]MCJ7839879.1 hypothetical protein [Lederbergia sp. NSJ-179]